jgi:peptidoglycan/xylan/chitin deacetylase (PgdA/CDA1 family)
LAWAACSPGVRRQPHRHHRHHTHWRRRRRWCAATAATAATAGGPDGPSGRHSGRFHGPTTDRRIALTVDDGTAADVVAGYVDFAQRTGIHLTFSPNGVYNREWAPHAPVLRSLIASGQVQVINNTFSHHDLRPMTAQAIRDELERNEEWVVHTFGITTRPYYRPPFGRHSPTVDEVAAGWATRAR